MDTLLRLQELDLQIQTCMAREREIPKQKEKFHLQKERLANELKEREEKLTALQLEQRGCESDIAQKQAQIAKYDQQLLGIKKNVEYQALLHEIDGLKKEIAGHEERVLALMLEIDEVKAQLEEDKQRIAAEQKEIDQECAEIDAELDQAMKQREKLEQQRAPLVEEAEESLLSKYERIRRKIVSGPVVVPLRNESCSGCNMSVRAQVINEVLAGQVHACPTCGRLLYERSNFEN